MFISYRIDHHLAASIMTNISAIDAHTELVPGQRLRDNSWV